MKSKCAEKHLKRIEKELDGKGSIRLPCFGRPTSIILPDTSAVIDLVNLTGYYSGKEKSYKDSTSFFERLRKNNRIVIPPKVYEEFERHRDTKINGHVLEIPSGFMSYLQNHYEQSKEFLERIHSDIDTESIRKDVYWASKIACEDNKKKSDECFSDVDKEILLYGSLFAYMNHQNKRKDRLVNIISSDAHVLDGAKFLNRLSEYSTINPVNFRG